MTLEQRVDRMERQNRALQVIIVLLAVIMSIGAGLAAPSVQDKERRQVEPMKKPQPKMPPSTESWTTQAEGSPDLVFRDKDGIARMIIGMHSDGTPYIQMRNVKSDYQIILEPDVIALFNIGVDGRTVNTVNGIQSMSVWLEDKKHGTNANINSGGQVQLMKEKDGVTNHYHTFLTPHWLTVDRAGKEYVTAGEMADGQLNIRLREAGKEAILNNTMLDFKAVRVKP